VALPAALQGGMAELRIAALRSDEAPQTAEPAPAGAAGKRCSEDEEETVRRLWDEGRSLDEIAQLLQRTPGAIASRFSRFNPADR
jgi:DNA-directed RNA polymerase specialized sigma24 family protein